MTTKAIVFFMLLLTAIHAARNAEETMDGPGGGRGGSGGGNSAESQAEEHELGLLFEVQSAVNSTRMQVSEALVNLTSHLKQASSLGSALSSLQQSVDEALSNAISSLSGITEDHGQGLTVSGLNTTGQALDDALGTISDLVSYILQNTDNNNNQNNNNNNNGDGGPGIGPGGGPP